MDPERDNSGVEDIQPDIRPKLGVVQGSGETSQPKQGHLSSVPKHDTSAPISHNNLQGREGGSSSSAGELKKREESPDSPDSNTGNFWLNEDKLNKGYTGKKGEHKSLSSRLFHSKSKLKQKVAVAGAATGGGIILSVIVFFALLPLKIESVVQNLENKFSSASSQAIDTETDNFYASYVKKNVLPALNRKGCKTTVSPNCVYGTEGKGPVGKLYTAWSQGRLEQKMATQYGIVLSSSGTGAGYNLTVQGHSYRLGSDENIFNVQGTHSVSTNQARREIRTAVRQGLKDATLYDRIFFRFKLGKFLENKYGIRRCVFACKLKDNFSDWGKNKKQAFQAMVVQRVVSPMSQSYGLMLQCIIGGEGACPSSAPDDSTTPDQNGDEERSSPLQRTIQSQLDAYAAQFATQEAGQEAVNKLVSNAHDISENGAGQYLASQILSKALGREVSSDTVGQALGPVNWIEKVANVVTNASSLGNKAKDIDYAAESSQAVQLASSFETIADEIKSGDTDATMLGSATDALDAADANGNISDATSTPLYASFGGNSSVPKAASIFGSLFGTVSTDPTTGYKCDNGNAVPAGSLICPEEDLAAGSAEASDVSNFINGIPLLNQAASVVNAITGFGGELNPINWINDISSSLLQDVPGVGSFTDWLSSYSSKVTVPLMNLVISKVMHSGISATMSGGRTFDMTAAGIDVEENASCQVELGCKHVDDATAAGIQTAQLNEQKQAFNSQPMLARIFSTDSPYSLVSRLAVEMPGSLSGATSASITSLATNPLSKFGSIFSALFSHDTAFADPLTADPFHVAQNAFTDLPSDPEGYWNEHCDAGPDGQNGDMGTYDASTDTLDISPWLNAKDANGNPINTATDPNTGQSINVNQNPCPLIHSVLQTGGARFNANTLPPGSQNSDNDSLDTNNSNNANSKTIVIDPGHSPATNNKPGETGHTDSISGLNDGDYENDPEMQDVWDVANLVKTKLTADGYNVLLTKTSEDEKLYQAQRSAVANSNNAALAFSIHDNAGPGGCTFSSGSQAIVYYQSVGGYRTNPGGGNKVTFTDQSVATTSKQYAQIFQKDRQSVEGTNIGLQGDVGYNLGNRGTGFDPGNIWLVQLLSKEPWIYNESCGNSAGQTGLNSADKQTYANGLIKATEEAVPITQGSAQ